MAKLNIEITETGDIRFRLNFLGHIYKEARSNKGECQGATLNESMENEIGEALADKLDEFMAEDVLGIVTIIDDVSSVGTISDVVKMLTRYEGEIKAGDMQ